MYWVILAIILNYASGTHYRTSTPLDTFQETVINSKQMSVIIPQNRKKKIVQLWIFEMYLILEQL